MGVLSISIPESFSSCVEPLLARMAYLFPDIELSYNDQAGKIDVRFDDRKESAQKIQKEIWFQLYREKVYQDTLPIRKRLYGHA